MSTTIYCELALYDPKGRELDHPNYKRVTIPVDYKDGFDKTIVWEDLAGAVVSFWALLICEKIILKGPSCPILIAEKNAVSVGLRISGKGKDLEEIPFPPQRES